MAASPLTTHLALHAFVEARHTDDHALMDAAADRLDLVARFYAERDSALSLLPNLLPVLALDYKHDPGGIVDQHSIDALVAW
jgi:hypothetical protein